MSDRIWCDTAPCPWGTRYLDYVLRDGESPVDLCRRIKGGPFKVWSTSHDLLLQFLAEVRPDQLSRIWVANVVDSSGNTTMNLLDNSEKYLGILKDFVAAANKQGMEPFSEKKEPPNAE